MGTILGLGNDILDIERIRESVNKHGSHFLNKLFSQAEQQYCHKHQDPIPHIAGRFAAKEAIAKAIGTGFGEHLSWLDIEILNDTHGKPIVYLSESLKKKLKRVHFMISISHCKSYASAVAIWLDL